jgi:TPR repeat protein|tara:strand:+ start:1579 stop:2163 length:585 start_codon:yes stop_codon:yes gene_type:complete
MVLRQARRLVGHAAISTGAERRDIGIRGDRPVKQFLSVIVVAFCVFAGTGTGWAGNYAKGYDAYLRGDFGAALKLWKPLAEEGDVKTQNNLAWLYLKGDGVPQDLSEAARWFRKAAEQGLAVAQSTLAVMLARGSGVPKDLLAGYMWADIAATNGNTNAANVKAALTAKLSSEDRAAAQVRAKRCIASDYQDCD